MTSANKLSPAEAERLALLAEECGEVIQVVGKILRHGYESYHPDNPSISNRQLLEKEIGDVRAAVSILTGSMDLNDLMIEGAKSAKFKTVVKYLHHQ